ENAKHTAPRVLALRDEVVGSYRVLLWTLFGAVGIVLLIACTNLTNMMLVRSAARRKDLAIRTALGGSRRQLTRELLTASVVLASIGGSCGLLLAAWSVRLLIAIGPADLPRVQEVTLDWPVIGFAAILSSVIGVLFGLTPAMQAGRLDVNRILKAGGRSHGGH